MWKDRLVPRASTDTGVHANCQSVCAARIPRLRGLADAGNDLIVALSLSHHDCSNPFPRIILFTSALVSVTRAHRIDPDHDTIPAFGMERRLCRTTKGVSDHSFDQVAQKKRVSKWVLD